MAKRPKKRKKSKNKIKKRKIKSSLKKTSHNEDEIIIKVSKHWSNKAYVNKNKYEY